MRREIQRQKLIGRRAALLAAGQAALVAALGGRLYQLQILESDRYRVLADENRINLRLLAPPRGRILDRFGVHLADNRQDYRLVIVPEQAGNIEAMLAALGGLVEIGESDRRRVLREVQRKHAFVPIVVRANLSWEDMARIEVAVPELPGISIEQGLTRNYPFGGLTAHILGYVAAPSEQDQTGDPLLELPDIRIGKAGVERSQDVRLRGTAGASQVEVNAYGRVVRELSRDEGRPGEDVVIGVDIALQEFMTRRCSGEISVASVLLDAITGEVLGLVSVPSFDPAGFATGLTSAAWQQLSTDPRKPLSNKVIAGVYPPGSTFKPVVAAAALMAGVATPDTAVNCPGYIELGDARFHCWRHGGHGTVRLRDAIKRSCDVYFYEMARRLGIDRLATMARRFGFGETCSVGIPGERPGLIPTREWKLARAGIPWQQGETLIAGIGQGSVLATPLQLAVMAARCITGRAVVARFSRDNGVMPPGGDRVSPEFPLLGINPRALSWIVDAMNAVVNEQGGTAYAARISDPALAMGGKSGTSQVRRITDYERQNGLRKIHEIPWKHRDHALFVAYAPVASPRYVCATVVEHGGTGGGGGSAVAAPICRDILREAQLRDPAHRVPGRDAVAEFFRPPPPGANSGG